MKKINILLLIFVLLSSCSGVLYNGTPRTLESTDIVIRLDDQWIQAYSDWMER